MDLKSAKIYLCLVEITGVCEAENHQFITEECQETSIQLDTPPHTSNTKGRSSVNSEL